MKYDDLMGEVYKEGGHDDSGAILHKRMAMIKLDRDELLGRVAYGKETVNIRNAVNDASFNSEAMVKKNNYITKSILCMPIIGVEEILGKFNKSTTQDVSVNLQRLIFENIYFGY